MYVQNFDAKEETKKIGHSEYVSAQDFARIKSFANQSTSHAAQSSKQPLYRILKTIVLCCFEKFKCNKECRIHTQH